MLGDASVFAAVCSTIRFAAASGVGLGRNSGVGVEAGDISINGVWLGVGEASEVGVASGVASILGFASDRLAIVVDEDANEPDAESVGAEVFTGTA